MYVDIAQLDPQQIYITLTQTVIPRPIAWVLSENANGSLNLAPYSFFNAVSSDPALVMISTGLNPDGRPKDTRENIKQRRDFLVHIASVAQLEKLNASSATLPAGESEVDHLGLTTVPLAGSRLPRLKTAKVAFVCTLYEIHNIGENTTSMILGRVRGVYLDDEVVGHDAKGRRQIHADRINPVGRLGASEYVDFGRMIKLKRPT